MASYFKYYSYFERLSGQYYKIVYYQEEVCDTSNHTAYLFPTSDDGYLTHSSIDNIIPFDVEPMSDSGRNLTARRKVCNICNIW